jgi:hypothetical protein
MLKYGLNLPCLHISRQDNSGNAGLAKKYHPFGVNDRQYPEGAWQFERQKIPLVMAVLQIGKVWSAAKLTPEI